MANKRGPKRDVSNAVRVGEYGNTAWLVELACGHSLETVRKPKMGTDRLCCKMCADDFVPAPKRLMEVLTDPNEDSWDTPNVMDELRLKALIASKVGVPLDQVELVNGTATIFLDAQQVSRLA